MLKRALDRSPVNFLTIIVCLSLVCSSLANTPPVRPKSSRVMSQQPAAKTASKESQQASEILNEAQGLLRRHRPDQALISLNTALQLFKQAGDLKGEAATHDALGDLYSFYGQYRTAVREYQSAHGMLRAANQRINADLVLAKLANLYDLMGQTSASGTAYAQVETEHRGVATVIHGDASSGVNNDSPEQTQVVTASGDEQRAFEMVNAARQAEGLKALTWDSQLSLMARDHAENMSRAGFRGHVDQNGLDMQERARAHGLRGYEEIGENIGHSIGVDPIALAVETWVNDAVHRDILLYENFTHAGLGIAKLADGGLLFTQVFIRRLTTDRPAGGETAVNRRAVAAATLNKKENAADISPGAATSKDTDLYRAFICYAKSEFGLGRVAYRDGRLDDANKHFEILLAAADADSPVGDLAQSRRFRVVALTSLGDVAFRKAMLPAAPQRFHHGGQSSDVNAASRKRLLSDALSFYLKAISSASKDRRPDLMWAAQRGIGRTQLALAAREPDQTKAAALREEGLAAYRGAGSTIESFLLGSIRSEEARKSFLSPTQAVFDETTGALAEMALTTSHSSSNSLEGVSLTYAVAALQAVEQGRARALLDVLDEARAEISAGIPAELTKRKAGIQTRQDEITRLINGVRLDGELTLNAVKPLESEFDDLESQHLEVENQIRASSPRYSMLTKPQPLTISKIQQDILDDQTALLEYSLADENSYLWLVTRSRIMLFRLPGRSIVEGKVVELRSKLVPSDRRLSILNADEIASQTARGLSKPQTQQAAATATAKNYLAAAHDLYQVVVEPVAPYIRDKRLLIVADGALHFIPFEALVTSREGESYGSLAYLVKSNEVIYAPSASVLAAIQRRANASPAAQGQILLLGDPVFDPGDERVQRSAAIGLQQPVSLRANLRLLSTLEDIRGTDAGALKLARLKGTRVETEQIVKLATASNSSAATLLDLDASETKLAKQDLSKYDILHFATHGLMNPERPQFTGLALSLVGDEDNDGLLLVDEVFNLRLNSPRLVMLSACETGLGKLKRGEGVTGLTRAFMYAGATTVGVSLWSVSDEATAVLMSSFYQRLFSKERPSMSAALRGAQLEMIAGERNSVPFYWASFVLVGESHDPR